MYESTHIFSRCADMPHQVASNVGQSEHDHNADALKSPFERRSARRARTFSISSSFTHRHVGIVFGVHCLPKTWRSSWLYCSDTRNVSQPLLEPSQRRALTAALHDRAQGGLSV